MPKPRFNFKPTQFDSTPIIQSNQEEVSNATEITQEESSSTIDISPASLIEQTEKSKEKDGFAIKIIPRKKIRTNKKNRYGMRDMERIKDSILSFGLQQNLTVIYSVEEDRYIIESGHRRCQALDELIAEFSSSGELSSPEVTELSSSELSSPEQTNSSSSELSSPERYKLYLKNVKPYEVGYPCKVNAILKDEILYDEDESEATLLSEARLIITNEDVRSTEPAERAAAVARLEEIYQKLNIGKKRSEKINVMEQVASDLNISSRQVAKYKSLNALLPELKAEFENSNITLTEGSEIGKLDEEEQRNILLLIQSGEKVSIEQIKQLTKEKTDLAKQIKEKEELITRLEFEAAENAKQIEFHSNQEFDNEVLASLTPSPTPEEIKAKEELHRREEEIKLLQKQVEELRNKPSPVLDPEATNLYRAELSAKVAHENLLKAQAEFIANFTVYNKLINAAPLDTDTSLLHKMETTFNTLTNSQNEN